MDPRKVFRQERLPRAVLDRRDRGDTPVPVLECWQAREHQLRGFGEVDAGEQGDVRHHEFVAGDERPGFQQPVEVAESLLGFLGLVISSFPYLVPPSLTIWQTAAAPASQSFILAGTLVLLPLILAYTGYVYWLFRGKVGPGESYH